MNLRLHILVLAILLVSSQLTLGEKESSERYLVGETITYSIKKLGVKAGEAILTFHGKQNWDGKEVLLITFEATALNFFDQEKIYIDPKTFFPLRVERDLNVFGKKEKIFEDYDSPQGIVKITKMVGDKKIQKTIQKMGNIDNIYCFIYRYRKHGQFNLGDTLKINLPTKEVEISLEKVNTIKAAGQVFDSYFMQSNPKKYQVWFDTGPHKIPIRIDGAVGLGNTSMVMEKYHNQSVHPRMNQQGS